MYRSGSLVPRPSLQMQRNTLLSNFYCMLRCVCGGRPRNEAIGMDIIIGSKSKIHNTKTDVRIIILIVISSFYQCHVYHIRRRK